MEHLIITALLGGIGLVFTIFVSAAGKLLADDIKAWAPRLVEWLIVRAVKRLPEDQRERYAEEWRSHINDVPGELSKVFVAIYHCSASTGEILSATGFRTYGWSRRAMDRSADVVVSVFLLLLTLPLMLLTSLLILVDSSGPILYRKKRSGPSGDFYILKFRSATADGGAGDMPTDTTSEPKPSSTRGVKCSNKAANASTIVPGKRQWKRCRRDVLGDEAQDRPSKLPREGR